MKHNVGLFIILVFLSNSFSQQNQEKIKPFVNQYVTLENKSLNASGGTVWYDCYVERTGSSEEGTIFVMLREQNNLFNCWFIAETIARKEMLSVALTALTTGKKVNAALTGSNEYERIKNLYVIR